MIEKNHQQNVNPKIKVFCLKMIVLLVIITIKIENK